MAYTSLGGSDKTVGVEVSGINKVVSDLETAINNLRTSVREIDDSAQAVAKGWKGDAHDGFVTTAADWHDEADQLNKRLDELSQAVDSGKSALVNMDQSNSA